MQCPVTAQHASLIQEEPLRFRIAVAKIIDYGSSHTTQRDLQQSSKIKNATQADVTKWRSRTMQDHDVILAGGVGVDDMKAVSVATAGQSADGTQAFVGELARRYGGDRLKELVPETVDED